MMQRKIVAVYCANPCSKLRQSRHVRSGNSSRPIWRQPQHELRATANCVVIFVHQLVDTLQRRVSIRMPEPPIPVQRCVRLNRPPAKISCAIDNVPVFKGNFAALCAHPSQIGVFVERHIGEHHCVRLIGAQLLEDGVEIILAVATACAIQPELHQRPVAGGKLFKLRQVIFVVLNWICVTRIMPVPRRQVYAKAKAMRAGGIRDHAHQIALAVQPGAALDAVICLAAWPQGESVMVFGD